ncbi:MAG: hypothetical protein Q9168_003869 [Polycauliona sp. 1 TL-2023]
MEVSCDDDASNSRIRTDSQAAKFGVLDVADDPDTSATHYRLSDNNGRFVYISVDARVYDEDLYYDPSMLVNLLPPVPPGNWNKGHVTRTEERPDPYFGWTRFAELPSITSVWHPKHVDFNELDIDNKCMPNVAEASHPELGQVIAKYARFEWEIAHYQSETEVYRWLSGHGVGPDFLAHLTEGERVIGFLLQKFDARHAGAQDLDRCEDIVRKLHSLDIVHGDLNHYNFLANENRVLLIDFETSVKSRDEDQKAKELRDLRKQLLDDPGKGG